MSEKLFNCISEILNFRYQPSKFSSWSFPKSSQSMKHVLKNPPASFSFFDYVDSGKFKFKDVCKYFLVNPHRLRHLKENIYKNNISLAPNSVLVIAGEDKHLSACLPVLNKLVKNDQYGVLNFSKIFIEAKNVNCDFVSSIPMGVNLAYTLRCGGNDILPYINEPQNKTNLVGTAFGSRWPHLSHRIKNRVFLLNFLKQNNFVNNFFCPPLEFYKKLSSYKFFLSPIGAGVQTPKICESILCETIPVVTKTPLHTEFRDKFGLPILIIDKWEDINVNFLNEIYEKDFSNLNWTDQKQKFLANNLLEFINK